MAEYTIHGEGRLTLTAADLGDPPVPDTPPPDKNSRRARRRQRGKAKKAYNQWIRHSRSGLAQFMRTEDKFILAEMLAMLNAHTLYPRLREVPR